jgi:predicted phage terminase large subunit-like protein
MEDIQMLRTKVPKRKVLLEAIDNPLLIIRELNNRSFYHFLRFFWPEISSEEFVENWHIPFLCNELQLVAERVARGEPNDYDLLINISPGTTKTITCNIAYPAWIWTRWHWMRIISASYSASLALEAAEYSRDMIRSDRFQAVYPELDIKEDKDTKSNFRVVKRERAPGRPERLIFGGNRYSTSVGGTLAGYHGHILIWDDPLNPHQAVSEKKLAEANRWIDRTLPTRKVNKITTTTIGIMQRLHQNDPSGHILAKKKKKLRHISMPGEIRNYRDQVQPPELVEMYQDDLFDVNRMPWSVLKDLEADMGQYGFAGQIGQNPVPPGGGMFKVDRFPQIQTMPSDVLILEVVRYWDKAGTKEIEEGRGSGGGAYTVGVKMAKLKDDKYLIMDVVRGRWSSEEREKIIRSTAEADGKGVKIYHEQEPGSGGKESAEATIKNLAGFASYADRPQGDKIYRADPYSVQVNNGNMIMLRGDWNHEFIDEHRNFPFSTYKDQVDAAAGAFSQLTRKRIARIIK